MIRRLKSGFLDFAGEVSQQLIPGQPENTLIRMARLVYVGEFESIDGPVKVKPEDLQRFTVVTNARLEASRLRNGGFPAWVDCPPIQLDHSRSARDTVGRLIGPITIAEFEGKPCTFSPVCFIGEENLAPASDGRWTNLSVGIDFDSGVFEELTVTPFPAAAHAALLSKGDGMEKLIAHLMSAEKLSQDDAAKRLAAMTDEQKVELSKLADEMARLAAAEKEKEESEKKEKERLAAAEKEKEEKEKAEKEGKAKLAAATKEGVLRLGKEIRTTLTGNRQQLRTQSISQRFSRLRAGGQITPAEVKKFKLEDLSKMADEALEAFFSGFEGREPVIPVAQYGSAKGVPVSKLATDVVQRARLGSRLRNMPFTGKAVGKRLGFPEGGGNPSQHEGGQQLCGENPAHHEGAELAQLEHHFSLVCKMMDEGKRDEALKSLREYMSGGRGSQEDLAGEMHPDAEKRMGALAESTKKLQNQFEELVRLMAPMLGIEASELTA